MNFAPTVLSPAELELQAEVRAFLAAELPHDYERALGMGAGNDREFSRKLAARGWLGMALPRKYGGHDRSAVDRFVVWLRADRGRFARMGVPTDPLLASPRDRHGRQPRRRPVVARPSSVAPGFDVRFGST